ncbi:Golgi transport complex subunit 7 [Chamberlinius hualienensis]
MDFSAFSDDNFDVKEWVNNVLSTPEAKTNRDAYSSQLVMKLQLFIQEINHSLEDASQHVLQTLPKVVRDAEAIKQDASLLQSHMNSVKENIAKVESDTASSMETLLTIDQIKSRVFASAKALKEADNWTTLSGDVEEVFHTGDLNSIAEKIQGMQQSLTILVDIPDYKERQHYLENLKNRLEAMVSPHLVNAIQSQSLDAAYAYVKVLRDIDRLPEIKKYYHRCQKSLLLQKWKDVIETDSEQTLLNWFTVYYDNLLSHWHTQMKWFTQVFPDLTAVDVLCGVIADTLNNLDPSIPSLINKAVNTQEEPLTILADLIQVVDRFSKSLATIIRVHYSGDFQEDSLQKLAKAIYSPFSIHMKRYEKYEQTILLYKLGTVLLESEDIADTIGLIAESMLKVFVFVEEANDRCLEFSKGSCYPGLLSALKVYFKFYVERVGQAIQRWQASLKLDDRSLPSNNDWAFLQQMLFAVQSCGEIFINTENLERTIAASFISCFSKFALASSNTLEKKESLVAVDELLEPSEFLRLKDLVTAVSEDSDSIDIFRDIKQIERNLCETIAKLAFDTFFNEIKYLLTGLPTLGIWKQNNPSGVITADLPTFGLTPQEYITKVGQYLMTIPQHIDPFIIRDNPAIHIGFKMGKLPFSEGKELSQGEHVTDYLLNCIANKTCRMYVENIFKVDRVTPYAAKQLATDIEYLCNVLDDLDLHPTNDLLAISALLKAHPEEYASCSDGKPAHIVSAIRGLRNLTHLES